MVNNHFSEFLKLEPFFYPFEIAKAVKLLLSFVIDYFNHKKITFSAFSHAVRVQANTVKEAVFFLFEIGLYMIHTVIVELI